MLSSVLNYFSKPNKLKKNCSSIQTNKEINMKIIDNILNTNNTFQSVLQGVWIRDIIRISKFINKVFIEKILLLFAILKKLAYFRLYTYCFLMSNYNLSTKKQNLFLSC